MTSEELNVLSRADLFALCRDRGIVATPSDTNEQLVARLVAHNVPAPALEPRKAKQPDKPMIPEGQLLTLSGQRISGRKYRVKIFSTDTDKGDVFMAVNGYGIQMKRNVEYILDECFVTECLGNSVINTTEQDIEDHISRPISRVTYPYSAIPI